MTRETVGGLIRWSHPTDENLFPDSTLRRRKAPAAEPPVKVEVTVVGESKVRYVGDNPLGIGDILPLFEENADGK